MGLTPAEKALFTRRRKEAYEALYPETRHGGDRKSDQVANLATCPERFTADTAAKTGESERTVQRNAELLEVRATQVPQDAAPVLSDGRKAGPQHNKGIPRQIAEETGLLT